MRHFRPPVALALLAVVLGVALWMRWDAFTHPHWKGDQSHYVTLAMKLDAGGLDAYTLRGMTIGIITLRETPSVKLVFPRLSPAGDADEGDILRVLKVVRQGYYDEPLHMRAPLFSYALMLSHRLFAKPDQPFVVSLNPLPKEGLKFYGKTIAEAQAWATVVPLFFCLASTALLFFAARPLFGDRVALAAAVLLVTNPVSLMTSQRILADDISLFFTLAALAAFFFASEKRSTPGLFAAGAFAGLALLARQTNGIFFLSVGLYSLLVRLRKGMRAADWLKAVFNPDVLIFGVTAAAVSGFWFWKVFETYGSPLHSPMNAMNLALTEDATGWFKSLGDRPHPMIFFSFGITLLSPLLAFSVWTLKDLVRTARTAGETETENRFILFSWLWILAFYFYFVQIWHFWITVRSQEHRYLYPAYPAIAVLAALGMEKLLEKAGFSGRKAWICDLIVAGALILNAAYGAPIVAKLFAENNMLL